MTSEDKGTTFKPIIWLVFYGILLLIKIFSTYTVRGNVFLLLLLIGPIVSVFTLRGNRKLIFLGTLLLAFALNGITDIISYYYYSFLDQEFFSFTITMQGPGFVLIGSLFWLLISSYIIISGIDKNQFDNMFTFKKSVSKSSKPVKSNSTSFKDFFEEGMTLLNIGRNLEALDYFEKALEKNQLFRPALIHSGMVLFNLKRYQEAIDKFKFLIDINPTDAEALYHLSVSLSVIGEKEDAKRHIQRAIDLDSRFKNQFNAGKRMGLFDFELDQIDYILGMHCKKCGDSTEHRVDDQDFVFCTICGTRNGLTRGMIAGSQYHSI